MSNEYLYDKKGNDQAISHLEALLAVYRIEPIAPKMSRATIGYASVRETGWTAFRYRMGFATTAIALAGSIFAFVYIGSSRIEYVANSPKEVPAIDLPVNNVTPFVAGIDPQSTAERQQPVATAADRKAASITRRSALRSVGEKVAVAQSPRLTKQEKYAYDQLMVALWITGSKLKVVQDTINRVDDEKPAPTNDKR